MLSFEQFALKEKKVESSDFEDELPTLECIPTGCKSCIPKIRCAPQGSQIREPLPLPPPPDEAWDGDTEPSLPVFMRGYDDDYILDSELGGEEG